MTMSLFRSFATIKHAAKSSRSTVNDIPESQIPLHHALHVVKSLSVGFPSNPIAVHIQCNRDDPSVRDLRGTAVLPSSFLKMRTLILAKGKAAEEAKKAGADIVGGEELVPQIQEGTLEFDRCICTPEMLPHINKLARILGPRGIMPTTKKGTVTEDVVKAMKEQADAVIFKADVNGLVSAVIGKAAMNADALSENIRALVNEMKQVKKGKRAKFVERIQVQAESGPVIGVDKSELKL